MFIRLLNQATKQTGQIHPMLYTLNKKVAEQHEKRQYIAEFKKGEEKRKCLHARKEETQRCKAPADSKTV